MGKHLAGNESSTSSRHVFGLAALGAMLVAVTVSGEEARPRLSLERLLEQARTTHPEMQSQALNTDIARELREALTGSQDWSLEVSGRAFYREPIPSPVPGSSDRDRELSVAAGLSRSNWNNGHRLSLGYASGYGDAVIGGPGGGRFSQFRTRLNLEYSIPLWRNAGGILDRLEYDLAGHDIDIEELRGAENQELFLLELGDLFLDWVLAAEEIRVLDRRLEIARTELERIQRRREENLVDEVDVLRAEDAERNARQNKHLSIARDKAVSTELATRMGDPGILDHAPEHDLYALAQGLPKGTATAEMLANSRILMQLEVAKEQLERSREAFANAERPDLSLVVGGALQDGESSYGNTLLLDRSEAFVLLQWAKPLGNREARANLRRVDLQLRQLERRTRSVELELMASVRAVVAQMREMENVLQLNREQITSAQRRTQEELRLYNQGRGELNFVLQSRDNEAGAEFAYAQNAATYQKLRLRLRALLDQLL